MWSPNAVTSVTRWGECEVILTHDESLYFPWNLVWSRTVTGRLQSNRANYANEHAATRAYLREVRAMVHNEKIGRFYAGSAS